MLSSVAAVCDGYMVVAVIKSEDVEGAGESLEELTLEVGVPGTWQAQGNFSADNHDDTEESYTSR